MSTSSSPTLDKVIENIMEDVLRERVEQATNQETVPAEEVREEIEEVEVKAGQARVFFTKKELRFFERLSQGKDSSKKDISRNYFRPSRKK